jgi:hypothetical protein
LKFWLHFSCRSGCTRKLVLRCDVTTSLSHCSFCTLLLTVQYPASIAFLIRGFVGLVLPSSMIRDGKKGSTEERKAPLMALITRKTQIRPPRPPPPIIRIELPLPQPTSSRLTSNGYIDVHSACHLGQDATLIPPRTRTEGILVPLSCSSTWFMQSRACLPFLLLVNTSYAKVAPRDHSD